MILEEELPDIRIHINYAHFLLIQIYMFRMLYFNILLQFLLQFILLRRSRDSSVGIATGYGLDDQGEREFESR
jgi:hypothetical protein